MSTFTAPSHRFAFALRAPALLGMALASVALLSPGGARADWPMARHDADRTASATGTSDIVKPAVYWRAYLGGRLAERALLVDDVKREGLAEFLYASGGRVFAKRAQDGLVWQGPNVGVNSVLAVADLTGEGAGQVVAASPSRVFLFNGETGAALWAEPEGEMGTIGGVRIGDVDGDGKPDVVIFENECSALRSENTGFVYSFAGGLSAARVLWTLPHVTCAGRGATALLDPVGDGRLVLSLPKGSYMTFVDGRTGAVVATSESLGNASPFSRCAVARLDASKREALVCVNNTPNGGILGHRVFVLGYTDAPKKTVGIVWSRELGDVDGGAVVAPEVVADLDGDGLLEIVASGVTASGAPVTYVLDAKTGAELAKIPGATVQGTTPTDSPKTRLALVSSPAGLVGVSFRRGSSPPVSNAWTLAGRAAVTSHDPREARRSFVSRVTSVLPAIEGSPPLLLVAEGTPPQALELHAVTATRTSRVARYELPAGVTGSAVWLTPPVDHPYPQLAVARSDGRLAVFDRTLAPSGGERGGIRFGGYHASGGNGVQSLSPVVASLEGGAVQSIVVPDSRGALNRFDAASATNASPPRAKWSRPRSTAPSVVSNLDGGSKPAIALFETASDAGEHRLVALRPDGTTLWSASVETRPYAEPIPGKIEAGVIPSLVLQWGSDSDFLVHTRAVSGATGRTLWDADAPSAGPGRTILGVAVRDWDGDGIDDVIYQAKGTRVVSGANGKALLTGGPVDQAYFLPTTFDVAGDGVAQVTLHGGYAAARTLSHDLTKTLWIGPEDKPYPYGAIAKCAGAPVLVEGSLQFPARLKMTPLSGASIGVARTLVLAGGAEFANESAAVSVGARPGHLTSTSVHANLTGRNEPVAVVGSSDGWLYAVNPCAGKLAFAFDFGAPVGDTVFGDTDGDGKDELITSVGDGYLYDLRNQALPPPDYVWNIDPELGDAAGDRRTTRTTASLRAKWAEVPNAEHYEVAAVDVDGAYLTTPAWNDVGKVTVATLSGLRLARETPYFVAVRGVAGKQTGPDRVSLGVTVTAEGGDAGDAGVATDAAPAVEGGTSATPSGDQKGTCGCELAGRAAGGSGLAASALASLVLLRRRLRRRGGGRGPRGLEDRPR